MKRTESTPAAAAKGAKRISPVFFLTRLNPVITQGRYS
jgi:hypothetical protein